MPQGVKTSEEIRKRVRELLLKDEKLVGKELKDAVEKNPAFAKLNLTQRTYQTIKKQELPKIRLLKASSPENTWSIGALGNISEITPEAVPHILEIQKWASTQKESISERSFPSVTVRQAKWISRLLPLYFAIFNHNEADTNLFDVNPLSIKLGWLWRWSKAYSINERLYELTDKKGKEVFDTAELDAALIRGDRIDVFGDIYVRFSGDKISGENDEAITIVNSDEEILKRSMNENVIEESAKTIKELPKFKNIMRGRKKNE